MPGSRTRRLALLIAAVAALAALSGWLIAARPAPAAPAPIGLFTSLPLVWGQGERLEDLLQPGQAAHPAYGALAARGRIIPLDTLDGLGPDLQRLVLAQPRPLAPAENVALDAWVRGGGQLLLFADPLLTEPSPFALGDPRRPQDIVLLSPILARWGLELTFAEDQPLGPRLVPVRGPAIPVDQAGAWRVRAADCASEGEGLLVTCRIGQGRVVALADADVLAAQDPALQRGPALEALIDRAFAPR